MDDLLIWQLVCGGVVLILAFIAVVYIDEDVEDRALKYALYLITAVVGGVILWFGFLFLDWLVDWLEYVG